MKTKRILFFSYPVENSHKAALSFYFKLIFSVKPSKFHLYFAKDCSCHQASHQKCTHLERAKTKQKKDKNDDQFLRGLKGPSLSDDQM